MEYIYAVMLLNKADKKVTEDTVTAVLKAAGVEVDSAKVKSLIAALDGVDIEKVIEESASSMVVSNSSSQGSSNVESSNKKEDKKEEKKEEGVSSEAAASGLGSLF